MPEKLKIGVIFGGRSGEHEVSIVSASAVMDNLDKEKYEIIPIGITKEGKWLAGGDPLAALKEKNYFLSGEADIMIDPENEYFLKTIDSEIKIDVAFPVLHGPFGEDGTIQGIFEMKNMPYVGNAVLSSAAAMDKVAQRQLAQAFNIPIVKYRYFNTTEWEKDRDNILRHIEEYLRYPIFVKPANLGSSVGISKSKNRGELEKGINEALVFDRKIIVEEAVPNAREIECAVLGNETPKASVLGEVFPSNEFYDYDAKYVDGASKLEIPADLPAYLAEQIQNMAREAFRSIDGSGLARIDFLVNRENGEVFLNEINTLPGFTSISMYSKLWIASGLSYKEILDNLIGLALKRHEKKNRLSYSYTPKKDWHK